MTGKEILINLGNIVLKSTDFTLNPNVLENYQNIYNYYLNKEEAAKSGINTKKGFIFCGGIGTGKTVAVKVMQQMALRINGLEDNVLSIIHINDVMKGYKENESELSSLCGYDKKMDICFDELGFEAIQKHHYGNNISSVIASLIIDRHRLFIDTGIKTHFTTNFFIKNPNADIDILRLYGERVVDRMKEMCNLINWVGGSLRK